MLIEVTRTNEVASILWEGSQQEEDLVDGQERCCRSDPDTGIFSSVFTASYLIPRKACLSYLSISESDCQAVYGGAFITASPEFRKLR